MNPHYFPVAHKANALVFVQCFHISGKNFPELVPLKLSAGYSDFTRVSNNYRLESIGTGYAEIIIS